MEKKKKLHSIIEESNNVVSSDIEKDNTCLKASFPYIEGWRCIDEVANDVWSSNHFKLLEGDLIFSYRSNDATRFQITIVRHGNLNDFAVGMMTPGYSMLLYHVPIDYLEETLIDDLKENKVNTKTINIYKQIIGDIKNEITSN